jgi:uncharacterized membrane protein YsdA (DUF1294 family)
VLALGVAVSVLVSVWRVVVDIRRYRKLAVEPAGDVEMHSFPQPVEVSAGPVAYRFDNLFGKAASVVVDQEARQIHFTNCFTPARFRSGKAELYTCDFDDLEAVYRFSGKRREVFVPRDRPVSSRESLLIVTTHGKATVLGSDQESYFLVYTLLHKLRPVPQIGRVLEHPLMMFGVMGGVFVGILAGALCTHQLSDAEFFTAVIAGALAGGLSILAIAWAYDRIRGY